MRTKVEFAELQTPLFLAGKNHGLKLFNTSGTALEYDEEKRQLFVHFAGKVSRIPEPNIASFIEATGNKKEEAQAHRPPQGRVKAQVSTPQDHVFSDGPGKTRD